MYTKPCSILVFKEIANTILMFCTELQIKSNWKALVIEYTQDCRETVTCTLYNYESIFLDIFLVPVKVHNYMTPVGFMFVKPYNRFLK